MVKYTFTLQLEKNCEIFSGIRVIDLYHFIHLYHFKHTPAQNTNENICMHFIESLSSKKVTDLQLFCF